MTGRPAPDQPLAGQAVPGQRQPAEPVPGQAPPGPVASRRRDPWRAGFFGVLVLAILGFAGWAVLGSSLLVVRHVIVRGNHLVSAAQVRRAARIRLGTPLARVNPGAAAGRVDRIAPVLTATVSRSWPDAIVITVVERTPALAVASVGGFELIDQYGVMVRFSTAKPAGMPVLTGPPAVLRGNAGVRAAALVVRGLPPGLLRRVRSVSAPTPATVTLRLAGGVTVVWGGPGQAARKSRELALLMGTHARYFDVSDPATAVSQG